MKTNIMRLEERLRFMKGQTFLYKTFPTVLLSYNFDGDYCTIATDRQWITKPVGEMLKLLDDFLPCEEEDGSILPSSLNPEVVEAPKIDMVSRFADLADIVMQNITKVQQDKGFVEQAQAVNNSVDMIIKLAKTEIEAVKMVTELSQRKR